MLDIQKHFDSTFKKKDVLTRYKKTQFNCVLVMLVIYNYFLYDWLVLWLYVNTDNKYSVK